jgi:SAM-dependent methyltransferase
MKTKVITLLNKVRSVVMRTIRPRHKYISSLTTKPISTRYGFDRGTPVDRLYIERFLEIYRDNVKGACLEIVDDSYILKYGGTKVTKKDVLDIFIREKTTINGDLRNLKGVIADNSYDTIIITQTFNVIDDYESAIKECQRILKPGGMLLVTLPTISPAWNLKINMWRFNIKSAEYVFKKYFEDKNVVVTGLGNKSAVECFWLGMSLQDMTENEINRNDPKFPLIIGIMATK